MIDPSVQKILDLSDQSIGKLAAVADRETLFASLCGGFFAEPPDQPDELANYGFGLKQGVHAVVPYCVSSCARQPTDGLSNDRKIAALVAKIEPYPIVAGSAVYLGVDHAMCDDVDLVQYFFVGTTGEERVDVARRLRKVVEELRPTTLKASLNNTGDTKPIPPRIASGRRDIGEYVDELVGGDVGNPDPRLVARIGSAQLVWAAEAHSLKKPISLQIHFVHQSFVDEDVHPYQEAHECDAQDFLHTNQHWLAPSFLNYFGFLKRGIQEQLAVNDMLKAAKRAAILFGIIGNLEAQKELLSIIDNYSDLEEDDQRRIRDRIEPMIDDLRRTAADAYNS